MRNIRTPAQRTKTTHPATPRALLICAALGLAGCGGGLSNSIVNPLNWFGNSRSQAIDPRAASNPLIPPAGIGRRPAPVYVGQPVDQISGLVVERIPGGALIRATGLPEVLGYYDVRLQPENEGLPVKGTLIYTLRAVRPSQPLGVGSEAARQVTDAVTVTDQDLEGVSRITVRGARNERTTRRR